MMTRLFVLLLCLACVSCTSEQRARRGGPGISEEEWNAQVLQSREPVLVDFWASWCAPCREMNPVIEALARDYKVKKVNVDANAPLTERYKIYGIPALLIFKDGKEVVRHEGFTSESTLRKELQRLSKK